MAISSSPRTVAATFIKQPTEITGEDLRQWMEEVTRLLNGKLSLGTGVHRTNAGNLGGEIVQVTTPATPDTDFYIAVKLDRIPVGRIILDQSAPARLYSVTRQSWKRNLMSMRCDTASVTFVLVVV